MYILCIVSAVIPSNHLSIHLVHVGILAYMYLIDRISKRPHIYPTIRLVHRPEYPSDSDSVTEQLTTRQDK